MDIQQIDIIRLQLREILLDGGGDVFGIATAAPGGAVGSAAELCGEEYLWWGGGLDNLGRLGARAGLVWMGLGQEIGRRKRR